MRTSFAFLVWWRAVCALAAFLLFWRHRSGARRRPPERVVEVLQRSAARLVESDAVHAIIGGGISERDAALFDAARRLRVPFRVDVTLTPPALGRSALVLPLVARRRLAGALVLCRWRADAEWRRSDLVRLAFLAAHGAALLSADDRIRTDIITMTVHRRRSRGGPASSPAQPVSQLEAQREGRDN